jgi:hypothetical protein
MLSLFGQKKRGSLHVYMPKEKSKSGLFIESY